MQRWKKQGTRNKIQKIRNTKMTEVKQKEKRFDLEERTLEYSKRVLRLCKNLPKNDINREMADQLFRAASSVGANYREANDALGKKGFVMRMKISRKEAKEAEYWLKLVAEGNPEMKEKMSGLIDETKELRMIFSSIISKVSAN